MNILLLAPQPFFQHRGTPIAVKMLAETLAEQNHQIHLLTYHEGEDINIPNVKLERIPKILGVRNIPPGPSWKKLVCDAFMFCKCILLLRKIPFDLIHAVEESAFMAIVFQYVFRIPFVYDMDSSFAQQMVEKYRVLLPISGILRFMEKMAVRYSIGVVAVCKFLENIVYEYDSKKNVLRLEDISLLQNESQNCEFLKEKLKIDGPIIMYVGNLEEYQGIDLLLNSFQRVLATQPQVHLVIIGGSQLDIQLYKRKSNQFGINRQTHFLGPRPIDQLASFLEQAAILISPRIKGWNTPMKIYSYLDSGKPVVATRLPTHTQVMDDSTAVLVDPNAGAIAKGICYLIENSDYAHNIARHAKDLVKKEFSYETFQRKLIEFYHLLEDKIACYPSNRMKSKIWS